MASAIKIGMAALVVFAVVAGSAGISAAGLSFTCPLGCDIRIDDLSETVTAHVIVNNPTGPPTDNVLTSTAERIDFSMFLGGRGSLKTKNGDFFEGSLNGPLSDRLLAVVGLPTANGLSPVTITFGSDVTFTLPPSAVQSDALVENGTAQTPLLLKVSLGTQINSLTVASDVDTVPEPSTLLLIGGAVAGLVAMRSRRRR